MQLDPITNIKNNHVNPLVNTVLSCLERMDSSVCKIVATSSQSNSFTFCLNYDNQIQLSPATITDDIGYG